MLQIGDKLVQSDGTILGVIDIFEGVFRDNKTQFYKLRPVFDSQNNLEVSFPIESLELLNHRQPISKTAANRILRFLSSKQEKEEIPKTLVLKKILESNDTENIARILKTLYPKLSNGLSITQKQIYQKAFTRLSNEIALVKNITVDEGKHLIIRRLERGLSQVNNQK